MNTEKPLKVQKPGKVTMADLLRLRHSEARSNGMYFPTRPRFSERLGWERVTKPKIFAPSEEPPVGGLLEYLKPDDFQEDPSSRRFRPVVTDCRVVASYNWLDTAEPTIAVPGGFDQLGQILPLPRGRNSAHADKCQASLRGGRRCVTLDNSSLMVESTLVTIMLPDILSIHSSPLSSLL